MKKILFLLFSLFWSFSQLQAQEQVKIDGQKYIIHEVAKGETVYGLSVKYAIHQEDLLRANPTLAQEGLKIGQSIRIPMKEMDKKAYKSTEVELKSDTLVHEVQPKETLYSLSKKYSLSVDDIVAVNPDVKELGLQLGMKIKIPVELVDIPEEEKAVAVEDSLLLHKVEPKETLYSLSKKYNVSTDSIQIVNGGLPMGLQIGTTIRIPIPNKNYTGLPLVSMVDAGTDSVLVPIDSISKDEIVVSWLLPLSIPVNDSLYNIGLKKTPKSGYIALDYLQGTLMAVNEIERQTGVKIHLNVLDTKKSMSTTQSLLNDDKLRNSDMVFGPFYKKNFELASDSILKDSVPMVAITPLNTNVTLGNPYIQKSFSNNANEAIQIAKYVGENFADSNIVLIRTGRSTDKGIYELTKKYVNQGRAETDSVPEVHFWTPKASSFSTVFVDSVDYYVIIPSTNQAYVSGVLETLNGLTVDQPKKRFHVFGMSSWSSYDNIAQQNLLQNDVHIPQKTFVDYSDSAVMAFEAQFDAQYHTLPQSIFSYIGYDITKYYIMALLNNKGNFNEYLVAHPSNGLSLRFEIFQPGIDSGTENNGLFIIEYKDFKENIVSPVK